MRSSKKGQFRLGCGLLIVMVGCLVAGGQALYTWVANRAPVEMTCAEWVSQKPAGDWLRLKGCQLDLLDSTTFRGKNSKKLGKVFIPVRPEEASASDPVHLMLQTSNPSFIKVIDELQSLGRDKDAILEYMVKNRGVIFPRQEVEGLLAWGIDLDSDEVKEIKRLNDTLSPDFRIMIEGSRPSLGFGILMVLLGCLAGIWLVKIFRN